MIDDTPRPDRRRRIQANEVMPDRFQPPDANAKWPLPEGSPLPSGDAPPPSAPSRLDGGVEALSEPVWKDIDDFARSGTRVFVRAEDGEETEAYLKQTRRFNPHAIKWEAYERWFRTDGLGTLNWKPVQYRSV